MKIQLYIDKLNNSQEFKSFKAKNPQSYFSAGFFVLDFEENNNLHQIDYYNPDNKKMITFAMDNKKIEIKESGASNQSMPMEISTKINLDLDILKGLVEDEMKNHMVTHKLHKIIAVLQNLDGKLVWNLNCITSDVGIVKMHISDEDHSVLKFESINLFDVVHKL
ncbi:hypothetical protein AUJ62_00685 [Candidatus Pacearchaeota archaeon CG1_02_32_21]|nr:MAG: hypothetical protein AUJ62_00685 [Candidatus Pacearchaeota archaeon CG1_02_32_21]